MMSLRKSLKQFLERVFSKVGLKHHTASPTDNARMIWGYTDHRGKRHKEVRISSTAVFQSEEKIQLSNNVYIGHYAVLDGSGGLLIGEGTQISAHACIISHSSHIAIRLYGAHYTEVGEEEKVGFIKKKTSIGDYVFIGVGASILPGVTIGNYALIGAGAVVSKDVPAFMIAVGNPAQIKGDVRALDAPYLTANPGLQQTYLKGTDQQET